MSRIRRALGGVAVGLLLACAPAAPRMVRRPPPPKPAPPPPVHDDTAEIDAEVAARLKVGAGAIAAQWKPMLGGTYLAPDAAVADDGGVDVVFHFHGAPVADKEWRSSGLDAVIVNATYPGYGVNVYREAFADPARFGAMLDDAVKKVGATHVRRLALSSWSAGYGGTQLALQQPKYYAMVDAVILYDGLHVDYVEGLPDDRGIAIFERFARDAMNEQKAMVITHSSVTPPGYASTTETASFLLAKFGIARIEQDRPTERGMMEWYHADSGGLHVRGYRGSGPKDHMDQVTLVDDMLREYVVPRWTRLAVIEERRAAAAVASPASSAARSPR